MAEQLVCQACGVRVATEDDMARARLSWSCACEQGQRVWTCERCQRQNLRSIEGKLDSSWW